MPALHGRNVPNCRPMVDGGMRKCSAGACPPLGSGWGLAESAVPIHCPNHDSGFSYLGVPAPAGMSDCNESMSRTPIRDRPLRQPLIRHSRHPFVNPVPHSSIRSPIRHSGEGRNPGGVGRGKTTRRWKKPTHRPTFILLCGLRKAIAIPAIKSMPRTPIRGRNPEGWGEGIVALGLVPSLGRTARSRKLHGPAYHHFPLLMRPSRGHGDSRECRNPGGEVARTHQPTPPRTM